MDWLQQVLSRLDNEEQVFILRRSAGFAFTFLSLLRSEVSNVHKQAHSHSQAGKMKTSASVGAAAKQGSGSSGSVNRAACVLLPVALNKLLQTIEAGLADSFSISSCQQSASGDSMVVCESSDASVLNEQSEARAQAASGSWRMCVHALNVVRLILLDAVLAPQLDVYIARTLQLAVRGFTSKHWAVRNSCMMVFASVIQRAVDNDKADSGSARAINIREFFVRFPSLLPVLVSELKACLQVGPYTNLNDLGSATSGSSSSSAVQDFNTLLSCGSAVHPSLFPILLLLSKLRASLVDSTRTAAGEDTMSRDQDEKDAEEDGGATVDDAAKANPESGAELDVAAFVPLVESCLSLKLQKVREMASKALVSLTCVSDVYGRVEGHADCINAHLSRDAVNNNLLHGYLLSIFELLDRTHRHIGPTMDKKTLTATSSTVEVTVPIDPLYESLAANLQTRLLPRLLTILERVSSKGIACPGLHRIILKILQTMRAILSNCRKTSDIEEIVAFECYVVLSRVGGVLAENGAFRRSYVDSSVPSHALPYMPLLLQEALTEYVPVLLTDLAKSCRPTHGAQQRQAGQSVTECVKVLMSLLDHPMCEVREGCIVGTQVFLDNIKSLRGEHASNLEVNFAEPFTQQALDSLLAHAARETKPSVLTACLETGAALCRRMKDAGIPCRRCRDGRGRDQWKMLLFTVLYPAATRPLALAQMHAVDWECPGLKQEILSTSASACALHVRHVVAF
jgi:hypothetical protein